MEGIIAVAFKIKPTQTLTFRVAGHLTAGGVLVVDTVKSPGMEDYCFGQTWGEWTTQIDIALPGCGLSITMAKAFINPNTSTNCIPQYDENYIINGCTDNTKSIVHYAFRTSVSGSAAIEAGDVDVAGIGCTLIDCGTDSQGNQLEPMCGLGSYETSASFSVEISFNVDTYMEIYEATGIIPCICHVNDGSGNQTRNYCSDLWCYYVADHDPCWIPPEYGRIWVETSDTPVISYEFTVAGHTVSGSFTNSSKLINPGTVEVDLTCSNSVSGMEPKVVASASINRSGLANPNYPDCTYTTDDSKPEASLSGSQINLYLPYYETNPNYTKSDKLIQLIDVCGAYTHNYDRGAVYVDGPDAEGAVLHVDESVPQWVDGTGWVVPSGGTDWNSPGAATLQYGGWWELSNVSNGPYILGESGQAVFKQVACSYDDTYGYIRSIGSAKVTNPGDLDQPDYACTNADHPNEADGCACTDYHDTRVLGKITEPKTSWEALKLAVPSSKLAYTIDRSITAAEGNDSIEITGLEAVNLWGSRYISLEFTSDDSAKTPFTITLDGKIYTVKDTNTWIDLLCPTNYSGAGTSDSIIPTISPAAASHGTSCNWDLGVYRINTLKIEGLVHGKTYTFNTITQRKKAKADGGSFAVVILPQASWMGNAPAAHRDPTTDTFVAEYAGQGSDSHTPDVWYQVSGLVFVDGMLAGEIVQTIFTLNHDYNCGLGSSTTGDVWMVQPVGVDATMSAYPGEGFITATIPEDTPNCSKINAYLNPGLYGDLLESETSEITINAALRLDFLHLPLAYESYTWDVEKYFNGLLAVRVVDSDGGVGPFAVDVKQGTGGSRKNISINTDKCGFGLTWAGSGTTQSLYNNYTADVTAHIGGTQVTGSTQIRNRKCSIITLKGKRLSLKYCGSDGKLALTHDGKLALTCCS